MIRSVLRLSLLAPLLSLTALAQHEEILVSGYTSDAVHRYSGTDGSSLGAFSAIDGAQGIAYGPDGLLYLVSEESNRVLQYDPETRTYLGEFVFDDPVTPEDETGGLDGPTGLVFGDDGQLYVASFNTDSVLRYDGTTGAFIDIFVASRDGGLNGPDAGLVFGPDGHLYVPSYWNHQVLRYDRLSGAFIDAFVPARSGGLTNPRTLVFRSDGILYVSSEGSNGILRYDAQGGFIDRFIQFLTPTGFAISPLDGNVYVTSVSRNNVVRFDGETGARIDALVNKGSGGLDAAVFLAFLPDVNVRMRRLEPGQAGVPNTLKLSGGPENSTVFLVFGAIPGSLPLACHHARLGIADPRLIAVHTDADGNLELKGTLDPSLSGATVRFQAIDPAGCRVSNLVVQTLE